MVISMMTCTISVCLAVVQAVACVQLKEQMWKIADDTSKRQQKKKQRDRQRDIFLQREEKYCITRKCRHSTNSTSNERRMSFKTAITVCLLLAEPENRQSECRHQHHYHHMFINLSEYDDVNAYLSSPAGRQFNVDKADLPSSILCILFGVFQQAKL
ncbi:hypothetical protein T03_160 [Trichinella britovi]|uniref:Secreted protein n=1 Tax=Trichinella britovi TaxID=45882 RepID=A0A0V1DGN0_TRIBR|nr:hypothetical protein T03_160 [Trichinella britovi]